MIKLKDLNRQVNIWRGNTAPPTTFHVWLDDKDIKIYDDETGEWIKVNVDNGDQAIDKDEVNNIINEYVDGISINGKKLAGNVSITAEDIKYDDVTIKTVLDELYTTLII